METASTCPGCGSPIPDGNRYCGVCGADSRVGAATRTSTSGADGTAPAPAGWNVPYRDGRFAPGTIIAERYRIVGLLGRGGMGEVYRADDLKLGRPVALKFLPEAVERDPGRLSRFLDEVRVALRVTHPNVCRVHDIGETAGQHFLSMEYVDGEDLGTLLRRVGRLPPDRATRAARQLCAGLAAAHEQGILHRDLKPANVMIDGRGQVRLTDFGLAGLEGGFAGAEIRAGTPFYMSPEQLAGAEVTARSDVYSLGLVLYELFTGKPAYGGRTPAEIARSRETEPTSPASLVDGLDPAIERVILRCLETDPEQRPASALAVAAALPGGDPLAAALAAGETPSPELLVEAGRSGGLRPATAVVLLVTALLGCGAALALATRVNFVGRVRLDKPPEVLADKAREVLRDLGWTTAAADSLYAFERNVDYYRHVEDSRPSPDKWDALASSQPAGLLFSYRESPRPLVPENPGGIGNGMADPPPTSPGMVVVTLDTGGRLLGLHGVPPRLGTPPGGEPDWGALLRAAGFDPARLRTAEPEWSPPVFADRRAAWTGVYPDAPDVAIRVEAAAWGALPVSFRVVEPWTVAEGTTGSEPGFWARAAAVLGSFWYVAVLVGAGIVAARNVRLGRGDRRTALRFAIYVAVVRMIWLVTAHHQASGAEVDVLRGHLAWSMLRFALVYVFYLALEPYARRLWPQMLVSWVRLAGGRVRDPLVGRDLLVGLLYGAFWGLAYSLMLWLPPRIGLAGYGLNSSPLSWEALRGFRSTIAALAAIHTGAVDNAFVGIMMLVILRVILRRTWIAVTVFSLLTIVLFNPGRGEPLPYLVAMALVLPAFLFVFLRFGLLSTVVGVVVHALLRFLPATLDVTAWYGRPTLLVAVVVLVVAVWGFRVSLAGRPLFRDEIQTA